MGVSMPVACEWKDEKEALRINMPEGAGVPGVEIEELVLSGRECGTKLRSPVPSRRGIVNRS
jgi:hypothetical protein